MKKLNENLDEYSSLRAEIISTEQNRLTCKMYMYTVFFTAFSFGFKFRSIFLVALIVLLVFQSLINFYMWMIRKVSIYIILFFEDERTDIHWERMQDSNEYKELDRYFHKKLSVWISDHAAAFLASITALFDAYYIVIDIFKQGGILNKGLSLSDIKLISEILCLIILWIAVIIITSQPNSSMDGDITTAIRKYKEEVKTKLIFQHIDD